MNLEDKYAEAIEKILNKAFIKDVCAFIDTNRLDISWPFLVEGQYTSLMYLLCEHYLLSSIPYTQFRDDLLDGSFLALALEKDADRIIVQKIIQGKASLTKKFEHNQRILHLFAIHRPFLLVEFHQKFKDKNPIDEFDHSPLDYIEEGKKIPAPILKQLHTFGFISYYSIPSVKEKVEWLEYCLAQNTKHALEKTKYI